MDQINCGDPFSFGSKTWPGTAKLIEECGEVLQVLGKLLQTGGDTKHWDGDLRDGLRAELADLNAAVLFFTQANGLNDAAYMGRVDAKLATFYKWHSEQSKETDSE